MRISTGHFLVLALFMIGCKSKDPLQPIGAGPKAVLIPEFAPDVAPTSKQILRELLRNQSVSLSIDPSCTGVGTELTDRDLGDYISGFLAEQKETGGGNRIEVSAKPDAGNGPERLWRADVTLRHSKGDDIWGWGVSFLMRGNTHSVIPESIRCTGSG